MTDVTRPAVRKSPDPPGHQAKLRARKPPDWRAKPPVPTSSTRFQAVPFSKSTPTRGPPLSAVPFNNSTPTRTPVPPAALPSTACQSPEVNPNHHDNSQSGASLIPSPSEAVRSVMTGAMRLTGLVRETMVKVTHAASATTSVVTRTCCAENTKTESSHHTATFSAARQIESYQMAIPTDDHVEAGPRPLGKASMAAIPSDNSAKTGPNAPLTKKTKALPVRKAAPVPQKSEKEPSTEASPVERQDSQPDQELGQTYSVANLRKLFGETYSVDKPGESPDFSGTYKVPSQGKDLGSTFVVRTENAEEVGALPFDSADAVQVENAEEVCAQPFDKDFNKGRKLCLMAIPTESHEEEEEAEGQSQGATNAPQPPSLTDAMKSVVVKDILHEGYSLDLVRHAVWRRLHSAGGVASRPELLQAVKDLEQEYTAAEKKLGDKDFLKEKDEINLALAMERREVKVVLSQGHDLETVRHVVWRRLQEGKGHFKSAPELLQAVSDLKREYEQANKKLADAEKTFDEKTVEYEDGGSKTADATSAERVHRSNSVADAMANPVVENVLSAGYSRDLVQHAVWRRLETHGENFPSIAELLQALKDLEDEYARAKEKLGTDELPSIPPTVTTTTDTPENVPSTEDIPPSPTTDNGLAQTTDDRCKVTTDDNVESELERYREEHTCKVCFDARIEVVFVPCGHYACCGHCADGMVECPMCRRGVDSTVKVFFS